MAASTSPETKTSVCEGKRAFRLKNEALVDAVRITRRLRIDANEAADKPRPMSAYSMARFNYKSERALQTALNTLRKINLLRPSTSDGSAACVDMTDIEYFVVATMKKLIIDLRLFSSEIFVRFKNLREDENDITWFKILEWTMGKVFIVRTVPNMRRILTDPRREDKQIVIAGDLEQSWRDLPGQSMLDFDIEHYEQGDVADEKELEAGVIEATPTQTVPSDVAEDANQCIDSPPNVPTPWQHQFSNYISWRACRVHRFMQCLQSAFGYANAMELSERTLAAIRDELKNASIVNMSDTAMVPILNSRLQIGREVRLLCHSSFFYLFFKYDFCIWLCSSTNPIRTRKSVGICMPLATLRSIQQR